MTEQFGIQVDEQPGRPIQVNVFAPQHKVPFFVLFPEGEKDRALEAAVKLAQSDEVLPHNAVVTDRVPGAIAAGTFAPMQFRAEFGVPVVTHAGEPNV